MDKIEDALIWYVISIACAVRQWLTRSEAYPPKKPHIKNGACWRWSAIARCIFLPTLFFNSNFYNPVCSARTDWIEVPLFLSPPCLNFSQKMTTMQLQAPMANSVFSGERVARFLSNQFCITPTLINAQISRPRSGAGGVRVRKYHLVGTRREIACQFSSSNDGDDATSNSQGDDSDFVDASVIEASMYIKFDFFVLIFWLIDHWVLLLLILNCFVDLIIQLKRIVDGWLLFPFIKFAKLAGIMLCSWDGYGYIRSSSWFCQVYLQLETWIKFGPWFLLSLDCSWGEKWIRWFLDKDERWKVPKMCAQPS